MARPWERPCSLDSGGPCRNDGLIQQHWSLAEARTATYVYGEEGLIAEYQAQGNNAAQLAAQYGWQPESEWGTDPVWIKTMPAGGGQAGYFYYQNDHLGTPQKIIDGQGQSVWSQKSTAFGETTVDAASALVNNLRFPGQYFDAETDLHYNGFRDYDPGIGRYIKPDPIGLSGGINSYAYVSGNPLRWVDPPGLAPMCPRNCASGYPDLVLCDLLIGYDYLSFSSAFQAIKSVYPGERLKLNKQGDLARSGPCGIDSGKVPGTHTNVYFADGEYRGVRAGSITSCKCCRDTADGPVTEERFRVH